MREWGLAFARLPLTVLHEILQMLLAVGFVSLAIFT